MVYHGQEGKAAAAWGNWLHRLPSQGEIDAAIGLTFSFLCSLGPQSRQSASYIKGGNSHLN